MRGTSPRLDLLVVRCLPTRTRIFFLLRRRCLTKECCRDEIDPDLPALLPRQVNSTTRDVRLMEGNGTRSSFHTFASVTRRQAIQRDERTDFYRMGDFQEKVSSPSPSTDDIRSSERGQERNPVPLLSSLLAHRTGVNRFDGREFCLCCSFYSTSICPCLFGCPSDDGSQVPISLRFSTPKERFQWHEG